MTQQELAELAAVGLRFLKELEQDKPTLRMDTLNAVLAVFGKRLGAVDASPSRSDWDPMRIVLVCNQGIAFRQPTQMVISYADFATGRIEVRASAS